MLIALIIAPFFELIGLIVRLLPDSPGINITLSNVIIFVRKGLYFTDTSVFNLVLITVVTWTTIQLGWAIFEWIYKKIPGIN